MGYVITFLVAGLMCVWCGGAIVHEDAQSPFGYVVSVIGLVCLGLTTFIVAPRAMPSGLPMTSISAGEYKTAFVYVAGENVNVGIEKKEGSDENSRERLYLYQFPKSAFDSGRFDVNGHNLKVVDDGSFRKLVLE